MRKSIIFERTLRAVFSGTDLVSHGLLLRAGFVRQLAAGLFSYLPLAKRSPDKSMVLAMIHEEIVAPWSRAKSTPTSSNPGSSTRSKRSSATIRVQRQD